MDSNVIEEMKAAIDIGTNTVLLLIGETVDNGLKVLREEYRMPRLGKGVDANRKLHHDSVKRVLDVLKEFKSIIDSEYPECEQIIITATSAVRDAQNKSDFINEVKNVFGVDLRLLSGDEEAQYTYQGALATLNESEKNSFIVLDIGGGSTEIASGKGKSLKTFTSIDMGCVRFTERFLLHNPPYQEEIYLCREAIQDLLIKNKLRLPRNLKAIGVAGTMTSLAAINMQVNEADYDLFNGMVIDTEALTKSIEIFSLHTHDQLLELSPNVMKGREDIFLAGLLILEGFLKYYNLSEIVVSTGGIRHGALLISEKD
jgi:exopolyphosphatase/guanosine-5'-triphosphate,3'-diphosphate pyrophosphatase